MHFGKNSFKNFENILKNSNEFLKKNWNKTDSWNKFQKL